MWHRFGQDLRAAILHAAAQAEAEGACRLSTRHLLEGLCADDGTPAARLLAGLGVTGEAARSTPGQGEPREEEEAGGPEPSLTPEARKAVERAYQLAVELGDAEITGEHLLLALVREPAAGDAGRALAGAGVSWARAGRALMAQQRRRTCPPPGVAVPGLRARRLRGRVREGAARLAQFAHGLTHPHEPFLPSLLSRVRTADDPYAFYARLRRRPFFQDMQTRQWIVTGYDDVAAALAEPLLSHRTYTESAWGGPDLPPLVGREFRRLDASLGRQMLFWDAPDHARARSLVARQFTPRVIAGMRDLVQRTTEERLDQVPAGRLEVIADLAAPLPMVVIARMLGVPDEEAAHFRRWSDGYIAYLGGGATLAEELATYRSLNDLTDYFRARLAERRRVPQDDLMTLLLQAGDGGARLTEEEVISNCLLLLAAGHENTTRLIGNGLLALLRHPQQMRRLRDDPSLIGPAVEELLRYDGPVQWTTRVTREAFHWRGRAFGPGQMLRLGLAAANRDPARFPDPDRLDITRADNRHLAFGAGPHFCLGAALTRLEAQVVLGTLCARFPRLRLERPPVRARGNFAFRSLDALHVRLD